VAGTIGARGNNGQGVAGVCWDVKMITAKFLGPRGGTTANAIAAIDYITDLKTRHNLNIVATNNSWGGGGYSQGLYEAIERANKANILFVAAAGNDGTDNDKKPHYPASYTNSNIISVGSLWLDGTKSGFSNYGATSVDIFAPGQRIWSTTPGNTYSNYSGTSMATPHVTGAIALYASVLEKEGKPAATAAQIKHAILNSAIYTPTLKGSSLSAEVCISAARLDAHAAWQNKQSPNKYNKLIQ
jgi:subtilisin family serine protease